MFFGAELAENQKYKLSFNTTTMLYLSTVSFTAVSQSKCSLYLKSQLGKEEFCLASATQSSSVVLNHMVRFDPETVFSFRVEGGVADLVGYYVSEEKGEETEVYFKGEKAVDFKQLIAQRQAESKKIPAQKLATYKKKQKKGKK